MTRTTDAASDVLTDPLTTSVSGAVSLVAAQSCGSQRHSLIVLMVKERPHWTVAQDRVRCVCEAEHTGMREQRAIQYMRFDAQSAQSEHLPIRANILAGDWILSFPFSLLAL